ncbi:MAG: RepB family plasmid replication initiator protein [Candidatus Acididesulfobacter guangdongensis]|uniref:RepB family plasmid replication initiator protein n=1 Tax=Acididesulfobacter guangdongensis TaxID=2597225 RepID=A0A519BFI8_ACIG2|nr:MAG: RepB family plasmid replication initiator protein [Candidatus Acididesulfobacter guangdongensis]
MKIINLIGEEKRNEFDGLDYIREDNKNLLVKKDNKLVFTKCNLSLVQMKIILVCLGFIFKDDISFKPLRLPAKKFLNIIGVGKENSNYLNKEFKAILSKPIETIEEDCWTIYSWFTKASCKKGIVEISLNPELDPLLLNLRKNFTAYPVNHIIQMNSKYNIRLYEIFTSVLGGNLNFRWRVGIDEFKKLLSIENKKFKEINQMILNKINMTGTDLEIEEIGLIKQSKKVVKLVFNIVRKQSKIRSDVKKILFDAKNKRFAISDNLIKRYQEEYKEINIYEEIKKMENWAVRKSDYKNLTQKDWTEFIGEWLKRKAYGGYFEDFYS